MASGSLSGVCNATKFEEAKKAYENAPDGSEAQLVAARKMIELNVSTNREDAFWIFLFMPNETEAAREAIRKLAPFYGWEKG